METKKRIYLGLLSASLLFTAIAILSGWYLITNRQILIGQIFVIVFAVIFLIVFSILAIGILAMTIIIIRSRAIPSLENIMLFANEILFPLTLVWGKLLGINREKILRSFIAVNNFLVISKKIRIPGEKVMILVPHCLQSSECPFKITVDIQNCKECGKCRIGELKKIARDHNAVLKVATGGTLARKHIKEHRPHGVVAIACERDLSSGIQDMGVLPVIGVLNCRPNGPCVDTDVNLEKVIEALDTMCKGG